jgi:hypothetical protein
MLGEIDQRRIQREAERGAAAKLRERRIIMGAGVAAIAFLVLIFVMAAFFL